MDILIDVHTDTYNVPFPIKKTDNHGQNIRNGNKCMAM